MSSFWILILVAVVMILIVVWLPRASGVASYHRNPDYYKRTTEDRPAPAMSPASRIIKSSTYVPPDEEESYVANEADASADVSAKDRIKNLGSSVYEKIRSVKLTDDDIPVRLSLDSKPGMHRRKPVAADRPGSPTRTSTTTTSRS